MLATYGAKVIVEVDPAETQSPGGIVLPEISKKKVISGKVICLGRGETTLNGVVPMDVSLGDHVLYNRLSGHEFEFEGRKLQILTYLDLLARI